MTFGLEEKMTQFVGVTINFRVGRKSGIPQKISIRENPGLSSERLISHFGHLFCGAFGYADDIIIFNTNVMHNICSDFVDEDHVILTKS
jgi:hypothetical protein